MSRTASGLSPEQLLSGPRGRRLLLQFAVESEREALPEGIGPLGWAVFDASYRLAKLDGQAISRFGWGPGADDPDRIPEVLPDDVARALETVSLATPTMELLRSCLAASVDAAAYWQGPDGDDLLAAVPAVRDALSRVAQWVASSASASWLSATIAHEDQWQLHWHEAHQDGSRPAATVLAAWQAESIDSEARAEGSAYWWSTPPHGLSVSCGPLPDDAPSGLWFVEDSIGWTKADARHIDAPPAARLYEIRGANDWARLCHDYPLEVTSQKQAAWQYTTGRDGRWVIPDWSRIAEHHDAVHLTYAGYLSTAGVPIPVDDDTASLIAGWNPDATYWLTDIAETGASVSWRSLGDTGVPQWIVDENRGRSLGTT